MKKWRGSMRAKLAAWVGITLCAVIFLIGAVGAWGIRELGIYNYASADACRDEFYRQAAHNYAVRALYSLDFAEEDRFSDTNYFRYGIIKAADIDDIDLNDKKLYIDTNFEDDLRVDWQEAYKLCYEINPKEGFYYNTQGDIYYTGQIVGAIIGEQATTAEVVTEENSESMYGEEVTEENGESMYGEEVTEENSETFYEEEVTEETRKTSYVVKADKKTETTVETYWVIVEKPTQVRFGISSDLFVQANTLATIGYGLRYGIYVILAAVAACGVFLFVFLMCAAGHRSGTEAIVTTWLDGMPLDVYLGFTCLAYGVFALLIKNSYYGSLQTLLLSIVYIVLAGWVTLLVFLTFAVRIKCGKWWQNTVIWTVVHILWQMGRTIFGNLGLLWKVMLALGLLSALEYRVVSWDGIGRITRFWVFEKIIFVPLILLAVVQMQKLKAAAESMAEGDLAHRIDTDKMFWEFRWHGEALNDISRGMSLAVDERMKSERFKTELITNVSHDIKTPLTSIINYVDLLEKENLQNEKAAEYLEVLKRQSARLKRLIEDLMEASKASTGNLAVHLERLEAGISLVQIAGEFEEKLSVENLELVLDKPKEAVYILADSRHFWRVVDNLMNNICKYAQPQTRVYVNLEQKGEMAVLTLRNTSRYPLNISSEELMERFVRGDGSRNTEGSGLGLSIAQSLMELMGGTFTLLIDGDLFKVVLTFPLVQESEDGRS